MSVLGGYDAVILVGTGEPVSFFGYQGHSSCFLTEDQKKISIDTYGQDPAEAFVALASELKVSNSSSALDDVLTCYNPPALPAGRLNAYKMCAVIAALQPEGCVVVEEGLTATTQYHSFLSGVKRHSYMTITGGAIGQGMPCALGAAIACPDRKVVNIQADGSAMYTLQALWSQARECVDVVTIICSNRKYNIVEAEYRRAGCGEPGPKAGSLVSLGDPTIDWVGLSRSVGVPAISVDSAESLAQELERALGERGPCLIEAVLA